MFWGLVLEPAKRYTQTVKKSFHVSQAVLDIASAADDYVQLVLHYDNCDFILANLSKKSNSNQVSLDLNFKQGDHVSFKTVGQGVVHLSGYHIPEEELDSYLDGLEEEDSEEETQLEPMSNESLSISKRKKLTLNNQKSKKQKLTDTINISAEDDEDDDFSDEDSDELDDETTFDRTNLTGNFDSEEEEDSEDEDLEEEDFDEEDSEIDSDDLDETGNTINATKTPKSEKKNKSLQINGIGSTKKENKIKTQTPVSEKKNKSKVETPSSSKKNKSKLETPTTDKKPNIKIETPASGKKKKQEDPASSGKKEKPGSPGAGKKKVLEGGVVVEELKQGDGQTAKPGKMVEVYYIGRLQSNNKVFDSTTKGPTFKFRLGRGEVIKGWDIGLNGMKIGGKRRIVIPPALGYGSKGAPPAIPPNSTLAFEVELRSIS